MSRIPLIITAAAAMMLTGAMPVAMAGDAGTVRIEPRPFYGATITLEAGVRVFRPLPPRKYVIINPGSKTPLNLSLSEVKKTSHNYNENHNYNHQTRDGGSVGAGYPYVAGHGYRGRGARRGHGGRGQGNVPGLSR